MTDPSTGRKYFMAPPEVVMMVRADFQEADQYLRDHVFDADPAELDRYLTDPELTDVRRLLAERVERGEARGRANLLRPDLQILGFGPDGRTVQVAQESHAESITVYSLSTRQVLRVEYAPVGVGVGTMVYDARSGRWKIAETRFVEAPPGAK